MPQILRIFRRIDWILFSAVGILVALGLLAIWSVDLAQDPGRLFNFRKQLVFTGVGFAAALGLTLVDFRVWRSLTRFLYVAGAAALTGVILFGVTVRGTRGWLSILGYTAQPVELAKIILIMVVANYLDRKAHLVDLKVMLGVGILGGLYTALTLAQPDLGSALVLLAITFGMVLFARVPGRYLWGGIIAVVFAALLSWQFFLRDYQKERVLSFLDPERDPFGHGYNIRQSVIAVGAGGIAGRGLGQGSQSQLRFLPEAQTDFIFAVLAEQLGLFGVLLVLGAYGVIVWRLANLLRAITDGFAMFCVAGFFLVLGVQVLLNAGMNLGVLPIVGLPLPFVSLGGSALLANFLMLGVVQSIRVRG
ncbi:rod shape-determining protein RodA [Candidatus Uhrbacteria bacterium]|nr:rod shape-determining protein RodA [Candidatus Uhrbacteria bacterium]